MINMVMKFLKTYSGNFNQRFEGEKAGRIAGERNVKINLIRTKLSKGKPVEAIAEDLEDSVENILTLIKEMDKKEENK